MPPNSVNINDINISVVHEIISSKEIDYL